LTGHPRIDRLIVAALGLAGGGAAVVALALPATAPAAANGASITVNHACYQTAQKATLTGTGFDPSTHWTATLDGAAFGSGKTTVSGDIAATFGVPSHLRTGSTGEDAYRLVVHEGKHAPTTKFLVTHLDASFTPATSQDLSTLRVSFDLLGWGKGGSLYVHYVNPKGVSRLDRKLGPPGGACGHLTTAPEKLFPFTPKLGKWTLQFDKSAVYKATSVPRVVIPYKVS
jgi:hypothetical protein